MLQFHVLLMDGKYDTGNRMLHLCFLNIPARFCHGTIHVENDEPFHFEDTASNEVMQVG
jgi:hypothetical protein